VILFVIIESCFDTGNLAMSEKSSRFDEIWDLPLEGLPPNVPIRGSLSPH
jgi:hypothetical protein